MAKKNKKLVKKGKWWFRAIKHLMVCRYKCPDFIFLEGKPFEDGSLIISNHEGTDAPMSLEMYLDKNLRMWGAHEMNSGVVKMYGYQSKVYFHQKKHWNLFLARLFCLIASPLTNLFYKGLNLISTYRDVRFIKTINQSLQAIKNKESIVVYPENSPNGYFKEVCAFFEGFLVFAEACAKKGIDIPIVVSYFKKAEKEFIFDKPIKYSELCKQFESREAMSEYLLNRCNELGRTDWSNYSDLSKEEAA